MLAVVAMAPGPPEVLEPRELPDPGPGVGQVLIDVRFASVTFADTQVRSGAFPSPVGAFPMVPGNGVGGEVVQVGEQVDRSWLGATVVAPTGGAGGYATRAVADADDLHRVPDGVALDDATAVLADGRTALALREAAAPRRDELVVVSAAAGGVGSLLVQLCAAAGSRVLALVGSAEKEVVARRLGAHAVVRYAAPGWEAQLSATAPDGVDVAYDGVGGDLSRTLVRHLRRGGRYLPHGAASGRFGDVADMADMAEQRRVEVIPWGRIAADRTALRPLVDAALALVAAGELTPVVGQRVPLEDAASAHAALESRRTLGKTLLVAPGGDRSSWARG